MSGDIVQLNDRERATLRAVGAGRAEITCSAEPDLFIDGLACCDQVTVHRLAHLRLIVPLRAGSIGERVPALLTPAACAMIALTDGGEWLPQLEPATLQCRDRGGSPS